MSRSSAISIRLFTFFAPPVCRWREVLAQYIWWYSIRKLNKFHRRELLLLVHKLTGCTHIRAACIPNAAFADSRLAYTRLPGSNYSQVKWRISREIRSAAERHGTLFACRETVKFLRWNRLTRSTFSYSDFSNSSFSLTSQCLPNLVILIGFRFRIHVFFAFACSVCWRFVWQRRQNLRLGTQTYDRAVPAVICIIHSGSAYQRHSSSFPSIDFKEKWIIFRGERTASTSRKTMRTTKKRRRYQSRLAKCAHHLRFHGEYVRKLMSNVSIARASASAELSGQ